MQLTVCTGFSPGGYGEYGRQFLARFDAFWPHDTGLVYYTEQAVAAPRGECRDLWACDGARQFMARHGDRPEARGLKPVPGWRPKDRDRGYSYRFDAVKFFKQMLIPHDAAQRLPDGAILCWLDADVMTLSRVPDGFIAALVGGAQMVYLGRDGYHSEIGFWAVRLDPQTRAALRGMADLYAGDGIFELPEWHSAFAFDFQRKKFAAAGGTVTNLTPGGRGHVWFASPLAKYTDHLKGGRKSLGRSPERDRKP